jgi:hypothetical protein
MRRVFKWSTEEHRMVEITGQAEEWRNGGERYGSEALADMKRKGLVPSSDFTHHWEKKAKERAAVYTPGSGHQSEQRKQQVAQAFEIVRSRRR